MRNTSLKFNLILLAVTIGVLSFSFVGAQNKRPHKPSGNSPVAVIEKTTYNAGKVAEGVDIVHDFIVKNAGTAPLSISHVQPSCGCTTTNYDKRIDPGKAGKISALVKTVHFRDHIRKTIRVETNDPDHRTFELVLEADIVSVLQISPKQTQELGLVFKGDVEKKVFHVSSTDKRKFTVKSVNSKDTSLDYKLIPGPDGRSFDFFVYLPADHPTGSIRGQFVLETTHPGARFLKLNVYGTVRAPLLVIPKVLLFSGLNHKYFNDHSDDPALEATIILSSNKDRNLRITKVESEDGSIISTVTTITPGQRYSVKIHLTPPLEVGDIDTKVTIRTNFRDITVPVKGKVF